MCKRKQRVLLVVNPQKAFRGSTCALEELGVIKCVNVNKGFYWL